MPEYNTLIDSERNYISIYNIDADRTILPYVTCQQHPLDKSEYIGQAFSILLYNVHAQKQMHVQHSKYKVHYNEDQYSVVNVTIRQRDADSKLFLFGVSNALTYFPDHMEPLFGDIYDVLNQKDALYSMLDAYEPLAVLAVRHKFQTEVQRVNRNRVRVLLNGHHADNVNLPAYINNSYVNIVHDCEHFCVQSTISNERAFMPLQNITQDSLLCISALTEARKPNYAIDTKTHTCNNDVKCITSIVITVALPIIAGGILLSFIVHSYRNMSKALRSRVSYVVHYHSRRTQIEPLQDSIQEVENKVTNNACALETIQEETEQ